MNIIIICGCICCMNICCILIMQSSCASLLSSFSASAFILFSLTSISLLSDSCVCLSTVPTLPLSFCVLQFFSFGSLNLKVCCWKQLTLLLLKLSLQVIFHCHWRFLPPVPHHHHCCRPHSTHVVSCPGPPCPHPPQSHRPLQSGASHLPLVQALSLEQVG